MTFRKEFNEEQTSLNFMNEYENYQYSEFGESIHKLIHGTNPKKV